MPLDPGRALVVVGLLGAVLALAWRRRRRAREPWAPPVAAVDPADLASPLRHPLTVVYFKSRFCSACALTPGVVREAAPEVPVVALDVSERPALAGKYALVETPTLLLVDLRGRIRFARVGNPEPGELWLYVREAWDSLEHEGLLVRGPPSPEARIPGAGRAPSPP